MASLSNLALKVGIDVNSQSFQDFKNKVENAMNSVQTSVQNAMPKIASTVKSAMPVVGKAVGSAVVGLGAATAGAMASVGAAAVGIGAQVVAFGDEYNKAMNQLQASTGATEEEMKDLEKVAKSVYGNNFGESVEDVANSMAVVNQQLKLTGEELQNATEKGIALRDVFGFEMEESTRAVNALMKQFGITADEAYNIIATGAQEGANQNGDLLDVFNEYSNHYAQLGLSAEEFTQSLVKASEVGVFSMDKVGDAVKEFGIRAQDGSTTSMEAFTALGFNAEEMTKRFASGGETARDAMFEVVDALQAMDDPVVKNTAAVNLFGTMYEDLGPKILDILGSMENSTLDLGAAMENISEVKYDDMGSALEGIKRSLEVGLLPVASEAAKTLTEMANEFSGLMADGFQPEDVEAFGVYLEEKITGLASMITEYAPSLLETISGLLQTVVGALATIIPTLLPVLADAAMGLVEGLLTMIVENVEPLVSCVVDVLTNLVNFILENLPLLLTAAIAIVIALANGLAENVGTLIPSIILAITTIVEVLINNLGPLLEAALVLIESLATGLIDAIPLLVEQLPKIIYAIANFLANNLGEIIGMGVELIMALIQGIMQAVPELLGSVDDLIGSLMYTIGAAVNGIFDIGVNIVKGLWNGITSMGSWLTNKVSGLFGGLVDNVKRTLGIHSPSKVFMEIGGYMSEGVGVGFDNEMGAVDRIVEQDLNRTVKVATDFDIPNTSLSMGVDFKTKTEDSQTLQAVSDRKNSIGNIILEFKGNTFTDKQGLRKVAQDLKAILQEDGLRTGQVVLA